MSHKHYPANNAEFIVHHAPIGHQGLRDTLDFVEATLSLTTKSLLSMHVHMRVCLYVNMYVCTNIISVYDACMCFRFIFACKLKTQKMLISKKVQRRTFTNTFLT